MSCIYQGGCSREFISTFSIPTVVNAINYTPLSRLPLLLPHRSPLKKKPERTLSIFRTYIFFNRPVVRNRSRICENDFSILNRTPSVNRDVYPPPRPHTHTPGINASDKSRAQFPTCLLNYLSLRASRTHEILVGFRVREFPSKFVRGKTTIK